VRFSFMLKSNNNGLLSTVGLKHWLYFALAVYFIIATTILIIVPQSLVWDPALCLKMTDNALKNIPFNNYAHPDLHNLNKDTFEYVTWWSPGQFAIPLVFQKCLGVTISTAIKITIFLSSVIAAAGIYCLFQQLVKKNDAISTDRTKLINSATLLLLFTICHPLFWESFFAYDGGGVLMVGFCPWYIYWIIKIDKLNILNLSGILAAALIGFFLKTSFTGVFLSSLLYLFLSQSVQVSFTFKTLDPKKIIRNGIYLAALFVAYMLVTKFAFLNRNTNISNSSLGIRPQIRTIIYPIVAPILGLFSIHSSNRTYQWLSITPFILVFYCYFFITKHASITYKYLLFSFIAGYSCFYTLLYFLNLDISYEARHFKILTLLIIPSLFIQTKALQRGRYLIYAFGAIFILWNISYNIKRIGDNMKLRNVASTISGLPISYPNDIIKKLHYLDQLKGSAKDIFYLQSNDPAITLEIKHGRILLEDNFIDFGFKNNKRKDATIYFGQNTGKLYIVYPKANFRQDSLVYLTKFEKYKKFNRIYQSDSCNIYLAIPSPH
jgi:hypothetical protein